MEKFMKFIVKNWLKKRLKEEIYWQNRCLNEKNICQSDRLSEEAELIVLKLSESKYYKFGGEIIEKEKAEFGLELRIKNLKTRFDHYQNSLDNYSKRIEYLRYLIEWG